jgi:hypothetical protein
MDVMKLITITARRYCPVAPEIHDTQSHFMLQTHVGATSSKTSIKICID